MSTRARAMKLGKLPQTSFDHMLRRSRPQGNRPNRFEHTPKYVQPKDRIALWNICPNDRVRVITGRFKGKVGTVQYVNREYNRVYLREAEFKRPSPIPARKKGEIFDDPDVQVDQRLYGDVPIHYSNVQLVLQRSPEQEARDEYAREEAQAQAEAEALEKGLPAPEPSTSSSSASSSTTEPPIYVAKRTKAHRAHFDPTSLRWTWQRLAESVQEIDPVTGRKRNVDWTRKDRLSNLIRPKPDLPINPSPYDTVYEEATKCTFVPSIDPVTEPPKELQIRDIEFVNIHGRAKKNERWHARRQAEEEAEAAAEAEEKSLTPRKTQGRRRR